ncbi:tRNA (guanine-N(7)-)-methyltransferase [Clostridium sp. CAG:465]|nr:tRNA (guanine-N(7)-)-methyltransferase [Clostridium sp. CAG:465]
MRTRYNPQANDIIENFNRFIKDREKLQGILNTDKKICIEIGMGKGDFISNMAKLNPDNVYIGIELSPQVLALAIKKLNRFEEENGIALKNLYFMSFDALKLLDYFSENQVDVLYLNFSDPWPKKRHTKRRLTYKDFLENYKKVLKKDGIIEFKTDNRGLFEYSLVSMQNFGMEFIEVYLDLHKTEVFNVETEYEKKFSPFGPIYKLVAKF